MAHRGAAWTWLTLVAGGIVAGGAGCFISHGDGACPEETWSCVFPEDGCFPAECVDGAWQCPGGESLVEGGCWGDPCGGPPPIQCYFEGPDGNCTDSGPPAECSGFAGGWYCPAGSRYADECTWPPPPPADPCEGLGDALSCENEPGCVPVYDNRCCPMCGSVGACADCTEWTFHACVRRDTACEERPPDACWEVPRETCGGTGGDPCAVASPSGELGCDVPGCAVAEEPPCDDCIPVVQCVPVRGLQCGATCRAPSPACRPGWFPEVRDGCYTGRCVREEWLRGWCTPGFGI